MADRRPRGKVYGKEVAEVSLGTRVGGREGSVEAGVSRKRMARRRGEEYQRRM